MFLQLNHQQLNLYKVSRALVVECYRVTKNFPTQERYALNQQINRAALSVHLNIAEGCARKSLTEWKRFFEISRSSIIELDAAFDIANDLKYCVNANLSNLDNCINQCFAMLCGMMK